MRNRTRMILELVKITAIPAAIIFTAHEYCTPKKIETRIIEAVTETKDNKKRFMVVTENGLYRNEDSWQFRKENSEEIQKKAGESCGLNAVINRYGFNIPFLGIYENILEMKIKEDEKR